MSSAATRLVLFMGATFAAFGVWLPYWPAWLEARGLSAPQIGVLMACWSWSRALSGPAVAHFVDASSRRRVWLISAACASVAVFAMFHWTASFAVLAVLSVAYGAAQSGTVPLGEGMTLLLAKEKGFSYSVVRAWGSAAFLAMSVIAGRAIEHTSAAIVQPLALGFLVLAAVFAFGVPEPHVERRETARRFPLRDLLALPGVLPALIGCGVIQAAHATYTSFATLHWKAAGHSMTVIGLYWAEGVLAEIALFAVGARVMKRFDERTLVAAAVVASCVRWIVLASSTHALAIFGTQWLHAFSFAAAHLALLEFFSHRVPRDLVATAQGAYSCTTHAAGALSVLLAGFVFARSPAGAFIAMTAVALLGGVIALRGVAGAPAKGVSGST